MADKEYIERGAVLDQMMFEMVGTGVQGRAMDVIRYAHAADVVEVVRCKYCAYREELLDRVMCRRTAHKSANGWFGLRATADNHFCSYGERKEQT